MSGASQPIARPNPDEADRAAQIAKLQAAVARGITDVEAGRVSDIETVAKELHERYAAWPTKRSA